MSCNCANPQITTCKKHIVSPVGAIAQKCLNCGYTFMNKSDNTIKNMELVLLPGDRIVEMNGKKQILCQNIDSSRRNVSCTSDKLKQLNIDINYVEGHPIIKSIDDIKVIKVDGFF